MGAIGVQVGYRTGNNSGDNSKKYSDEGLNQRSEQGLGAGAEHDYKGIMDTIKQQAGDNSYNKAKLAWDAAKGMAQQNLASADPDEDELDDEINTHLQRLYQHAGDDNDFNPNAVRQQMGTQADLGTVAARAVNGINKGIGGVAKGLYDVGVGGIAEAVGGKEAGDNVRNAVNAKQLAGLASMGEDLGLMALAPVTGGASLGVMAGKNVAEQGRNLSKAITGKDKTTGENLDTGQRGLAGLEAAVPIGLSLAPLAAGKLAKSGMAAGAAATEDAFAESAKKAAGKGMSEVGEDMTKEAGKIIDTNEKGIEAVNKARKGVKSDMAKEQTNRQQLLKDADVSSTKEFNEKYQPELQSKNLESAENSLNPNHLENIKNADAGELNAKYKTDYDNLNSIQQTALDARINSIKNSLSRGYDSGIKKGFNGLVSKVNKNYVRDGGEVMDAIQDIRKSYGNNIADKLEKDMLETNPNMIYNQDYLSGVRDTASKGLKSINEAKVEQQKNLDKAFDKAKNYSDEYKQFADIAEAEGTPDLGMNDLFTAPNNNSRVAQGMENLKTNGIKDTADKAVQAVGNDMGEAVNNAGEALREGIANKAENLRNRFTGINTTQSAREAANNNIAKNGFGSQAVSRAPQVNADALKAHTDMIDEMIKNPNLSARDVFNLQSDLTNKQLLELDNGVYRDAMNDLFNAVSGDTVDKAAADKALQTLKTYSEDMPEQMLRIQDKAYRGMSTLGTKGDLKKSVTDRLAQLGKSAGLNLGISGLETALSTQNPEAFGEQFKQNVQANAVPFLISALLRKPISKGLSKTANAMQSGRGDLKFASLSNKGLTTDGITKGLGSVSSGNAYDLIRAGALADQSSANTPMPKTNDEDRNAFLNDKVLQSYLVNQGNLARERSNRLRNYEQNNINQSAIPQEVIDELRRTGVTR